jgi:transcriptional regulator with XRE-family HTH domain
MKATAANLKSVDGKTQEQIAYLLGVAQNTISDWLSTIAADNVQPTDPAADPATELNRDRRKKLTAAQKKNIAARAKKGETQAALAEEYGVDKATISHVVHGAAEPIGWVVDRHKPTRAIPVYKTYGDNEGYAGKQPRGKKRAKHYDVRLFDFYPTLEAANVAIAKAKDNNDSARAAKKGAPLPPDPVQTMDPPGDGEDDADTDAPAGDADSEDVDDIVGSLNDLLRKGDELHVALVAFIQEQADYSAADRIAVWDALGRLATRAENLQGRIDTD